MKVSVNKYEVFGVLVSVAAMVVVLMYVNQSEEKDEGQNNADTDAATVETSSAHGGGSALANAIADASVNGGLNSLVVDDARLGDGAVVKEGDTVVVDYIGATRDGIQFDSSYERGQPFTFTVGEGRVIEGWEDGLVGMKVGGQRILIIPPEMGYGNRTVGPIPANSILVFAVELISIEE